MIDPAAIRDLFDRAVSLRVQDRAAFLDSACGIQTPLRREVERLLAGDAGAQSLFDSLDPAGTDASPSVPPSVPSALSPGMRLGPYTIERLLGAGGMGEVYRARDTRLGRTVAMKVLPAHVSSDPLARQRFEREARAVAALSDPHICPLFDVGRAGAIDYLVMEFLAGETLAARLHRGRLPFAEAVAIGTQIAAALSAAHRAGIVHRDLKPGNVMLTESGVRLLDFGLAHHAVPLPASASALTGPEPLTGTGTIVGTLPYMAPEQLDGRAIDARTDIFAFGVVLYEMVTGRRAFEATTQAALIGSILTDDPPSIASIDPKLPAALDRVVRRAIAKDPRGRWSSIDEMHAALEGVQSAPRHRSRVPVALFAFAVLALLAATALQFRPPGRLPTLRAVRRLTHDRTAKDYLYTDGTRIFFTAWTAGLADTRLFQAPITGGEPVAIPTSLAHPFIEDVFPGGKELLVTTSEQKHFFALPVTGGQAHPVGPAAAGAAAVSPDGRQIAYESYRELFIASSDGSSARRVLRAPNVIITLRWHPDGSRLRYTVAQGDARKIWEVGADGRGAHEVLPRWTLACCGAWTPDGRYFVFEAERDGDYGLWVLPETTTWPWSRSPAEPIKLTTGPMRYENASPAPDGHTILALGSVQGVGELIRLDRGSHTWVPMLADLPARHVAFAADGQWIAFVSLTDATLWRSRPDGREGRQLTFAPASVYLPRWSPDSHWIAYVSRLAGSAGGTLSTLAIVAASGGEPRHVTSAVGLNDPTWSPDGSRLLFGDQTGLHIIDVSSRRVSDVEGTRDLASPRWSPDGRWIVACSRDGAGLHLFEVGTGRRTDLTTGPRGYGSPNWTRDSSSIVVQHGGAIERVHVPDGATTRVASLEGIRQVILDGGETGFGLTPEDEPLLVRQAAPMREIYALDVEWP